MYHYLVRLRVRNLTWAFGIANSFVERLRLVSAYDAVFISGAVTEHAGRITPYDTKKHTLLDFLLNMSELAVLIHYSPDKFNVCIETPFAAFS